jgi:hypothetical protein
MKEQTAVSKQAADAALPNAQAIVNAERPWLLVEADHGIQGVPSLRQILNVSFTARNVGRSPAEIIHSALESKAVLFGEEINDRNPFLSE